jgi:hypothetical protein
MGLHQSPDVRCRGLWVNLGDSTRVRTATDFAGNVFATTVNIDDEFGLVRAKINWKF